MAGAATEESGAGRSFEGVGGQLQQQTCQAGEALAEWRSSEQVENGTPSTSPPYWDSDDDDDDGGPKPSELFGKHTWKIEKFSQISKRELRSTPFDIGGYKWYILIYPQGCDVCNHLSLFLCVANHDKLLPGWSHFAQFTICVVNKDPKKSKYSDTLHRFWKKEHDWGWKKFMELSKLVDGFIDADNLTIKAQVQVIHERADRPFRCLDCAYRRELVRVYLTNVEQICRRFVEERRVKLGKLIDDKAKWSSFSAFWRGMDQSSKRRMSQEKTESILKIVVKHFFIEKEVTSTLVMDSLYSGLRALEGHLKGKKSKSLCLNAEESAGRIVRIDNDMFILVDDVLPLLERVAMEPLPPKDDKGPQNRTKDTVAGEDFNKESIEHDERRLTELGRRTLEIFILAHIFSKIEVSYQEAVALKRQEELIREEEEAWLAEIEQKARRAADKEKKSKKKQGKQKRNNRKGKDKGRDDNASIGEGKSELDSPITNKKEPVTPDPEMVPDKSDAVEDASDVSDSAEGVPQMLPADSEDRDASPVNWDTDASEVHPPTEASSSGISGLSSVQNGRGSSVLDDSSSSCSSDSVPFVAVSASQRGNSQHKNPQKSPRRSRNPPSKTSYFNPWANSLPSRASEAIADADAPRSSKAIASTAQAVDCSSPQRVVNGAQQNVPEKLRVDENGSSKRSSGSAELSGDRMARVISPPPSSLGNISSISNSESKSSAVNGPPTIKKQSSNSPKQADGPVRSSNLAEKPATPKPDTPKLATPKPVTKPSGHVGSEKSPTPQATSTTDKPSTTTPVMSRPLSAPLIPGAPKHPVSVALPTLQSGLTLSRSVSAVGRLGLEPTQSSIPQSYRNAILGNSGSGSLPAAPNHSVSSAVNVSSPYTQAQPALVSAPLRPDRMDPNQNNIRPSFSFGMMNRPENISSRPDKLPNRQWMEFPERNLSGNRGSLLNDLQSFDVYDPVHSRSLDPFRFPPSTSTRQSHGFPDEFPHLDIINDLLEDEQGVRNLTTSSPGHRIFSNGHDFVNQQSPFSFNDPGISNGPGLFDRARSPLDDSLQHSYVPSRASYDMIPQSSPRSYMSGPRTDGLFPNQWHIQVPDPPLPNNGYPYPIPEYRNNLSAGANNYTVFRPSNGH